MTHWPSSAILALAPLLFASSAMAAPAAHRVHVSMKVTPRDGAHGCPSEKELEREVTDILGYVPFRNRAPRRVTSVLTAKGGTLHVRIELLDAQTHKRLGVRELSSNGPNCDELRQAMAFAIALAIDPLAPSPPLLPVAASSLLATESLPGAGSPAAVGTAGAATSAAALSVQPLSPASPPPVRRPPQAVLDAGTAPVTSALAQDSGPEPLVAPTEDGGIAAEPLATAAEGADAGVPVLAVAAPPSPAAHATVPGAAPNTDSRFPYFLVGAGAEWTGGLVPRHAFGALLHGGVAWSFASVELEAQWLPATSLAYEGGTISSTLVTGSVVGCATFGQFSACGLLQTGPFSSQGSGFSGNNSPTTWTFALGARAQWDWVFAHPVGLRLQADGLVNVVRTRLLVGTEVVWEAPSFAFDLGVGVFIVF